MKHESSIADLVLHVARLVEYLPLQGMTAERASLIGLAELLKPVSWRRASAVAEALTADREEGSEIFPNGIENAHPDAVLLEACYRLLQLAPAEEGEIESSVIAGPRGRAARAKHEGEGSP